LVRESAAWQARWRTAAAMQVRHEHAHLPTPPQVRRTYEPTYATTTRPPFREKHDRRNAQRGLMQRHRRPRPSEQCAEGSVYMSAV